MHGDDNGDVRPTSTVALATTQNTTQREVTGRGQTGGETGGWRSAVGGRADVHAYARAVLVDVRGLVQLFQKSRLFVGAVVRGFCH